MAKSRNQVLRRLKLQAKAVPPLIPAPREDPEATSSTAVLLEQDTTTVPVDEPTEELVEDQGEESPAEGENTTDPKDPASQEQAHDDPAEDEDTADPEDQAPEDRADQVPPTRADPDPEEYDQGRAYAAAYALAFAAARATREGRTYGDPDAYAVPVAEAEAGVGVGDTAPAAPADQPPDPAPARTRRMGPAVLVLAGVAALVVALLVLLPLGSSDPSRPTGTGLREKGSAAQFAALPPNGSFTRTRVLTSGDLRVDQWIRSRVQLSSLTLAVPRVAGLDPGSVSADDVTVVAGGGRVKGATSVGPTAEIYRFDAPSRCTSATPCPAWCSGARQRKAGHWPASPVWTSGTPPGAAPAPPPSWEPRS